MSILPNDREEEVVVNAAERQELSDAARGFIRKSFPIFWATTRWTSPRTFTTGLKSMILCSRFRSYPRSCYEMLWKTPRHC